MKKALLRFVGTYLLFVLVFILQKPIFMLYNHKLLEEPSFSDYLHVIWNGLPLDFAVAGYFTAIPGLLLIAGLWIFPHIIKPIFKGYFAVISLILSVIFITDLILYEYWGFRLDSTPFFYFFSSPKDAFASSGILLIIIAILGVSLITWLLYILFAKLIVNSEKDSRPPKGRGKISFVLLLLTALLFIPIRGGFTVSTMNVSKVYFSDNLYLNHAAINPFFSLLESLTREKNFGEQYRYMPAEKANEVFNELKDKPVATDSLSAMPAAPQILTTNRPNIIFVVLESFFSKAMTTLGGLPNVAVNMDKLAEEGVLFTNFYSNSFRTDRGLVSLFSGYPAQPTTSIMKYPKKAQSLPSIPRSLKEAGYNVEYYYGGDADFTNMRAYLLSMGISKIISDVDFPISERLSKWGAHDHVVFNRLANDLQEKQQEPFMKIIQTSSSHEPFIVPFEKLEDPFLNSVAYADSCLGDFIHKYKEMGQWDNSLIILVPDHSKRYPESIPDLSFERFQIPMIFTGGAIKESMQIDSYASQIDIAATLLYQLGIAHDQFSFSKNILNPASPHFAFFTFPNAFGMITEDNQLIFDCESEKTVISEGGDSTKNLESGKAILQKLYDDLDNR
ncbi:LTA synthase family protein [Bacteroides sp. 224]|uniref:LTA synthase family protein n=1 Tax=Bacteroides sp. 224 TaxID=2302936 RepID=UPI0013D2088E|nr:alkaline phosphatase family protein [Bacteroides sp. 224]NDV65085.1 alkaline phosphatase family protein [Bacteroides sp. 224]